MRKVVPTLIIIVAISIGIISAASNVMGQVQIPQLQLNTPRIIVLGNPAVIPLQLTLQLPTGFSWTASRDLPFSIDTGDLEDLRALFLLDDVTDVNEAIMWAKEVGKEEVYFFYLPPLPPDVEIVPFDLPELDWNSWKDSFSEFISPTEALADTVPPPSCPGKIRMPAGGCVYGGCVGEYATTGNNDAFICDPDPEVDDDTTDGRQPSVTVCFMYENFDCHYKPMDFHIRRNIWLIRGHNAAGGWGYIIY